MEIRFSLEGGGEFICREEAARWVIRIVRSNDGKGLYKAWLLGNSGSFPLGTLIPDGNGLTLTRTLLKEDLAKAGCLPPVGGRVELAIPFGDSDTPAGWIRENYPARLLRWDPILTRAAEEARAALLCRKGTGFLLALPWGNQDPFPLVPLFCFAKAQSLGGNNYAVFLFTSEGKPLFPVENS